MGMYSSFTTQDIEVINKEELAELSLNEEITNGLISKEGDIDFCAWDGDKIYGYWFKETVDVLNAIAPFIEGYAQFQYEGGFSFRIVFMNQKAWIQVQPDIEWEKTPLQEMREQ